MNKTSINKTYLQNLYSPLKKSNQDIQPKLATTKQIKKNNKI